MEVTLKTLDELEKSASISVPYFKSIEQVEQPVFLALITLAREALLHKKFIRSLLKNRSEIDVTFEELETIVASLRRLYKEPVEHNPWISVIEHKPPGSQIVFMYSQENNEYSHGHFVPSHAGVAISHWKPCVPPKEVDWFGPDNESAFSDKHKKGYYKTQQEED